MRRLNLAFLAILVAVLAVFGGGIHFIHGFQVRRNASSLLDRARRAEAAKDLEKTEQSLREFLNIRQEDGPAWEWYARIVDQQHSDHRRSDRVFLIHEQALRYNPGDSKLERRCADLALELKRYSDAQRHLATLLEKAPRDSHDQAATAERAELEDLLGQCDRGLTRYEDAERSFVQALTHDSRRVSCYDRLARLRRTDLRQNDSADGTVKEMVAKNPKMGLAYLYRWRYSQEFSPPPDTNDLQTAMKLAPDDPEVILTAAVASEQKQDTASARAYFEKGRKLDPKNAAFALGLAGLETRAGHLDQAETVLRQAFQANPTLDVVFVLADTLIAQNKIDAKDQANDFIARLRGAGLGDTLVKYLEAEILFRQEKWAEAIPRLEIARAILKSEPRLATQLNLMLAECCDHVGFAAQRLDALRQAAAGDRGPESARIEFARALVRAGKLDQALVILSPLAERKPELRLDLVALLLQKTARQPAGQQDWQEVERHLLTAEKALPQSVESLTLLRADMLIAQDHLEDARTLLASAQAKDPRNLRYRLAVARLTGRQGKSSPLQILDQAEKDLGPSLDIQMARLDYWGLAGGEAAKAAVAKLAEPRLQILAAQRPAFLDRLALTEIRLRELAPARQYWRELASLEPVNIRVRLRLFDLAVEAGDHATALDLVGEIRKIEGDKGTFWRFAKAALLLDGVRRGVSQDLTEARRLAAEISERQPDWWAGPTLNGEIAELAGSPDQAIEHYLRAFELGNIEPSFARRLVGLLNQRNRFDEIDRVAQVLRDQGVALDEITIAKAFGAIRKQDFDGALALARQVFSEASTNASDHRTLGRFYMAAGRKDEAGKEFRRAVELGPGVPESWLIYVQYLVETKRIDQARATIVAAKKALPADRATMTLAQCCLALGDAKQAEELIGKAFNDEGKSGDPAALRIAATVALTQNRHDEVNKYLDKLEKVTSLSSSDKTWVNRSRIALLLSTGRFADQDQALGLVEQNLRIDPNDIDDQQLKATILALRPSRRGEAVKILEQLGSANRLGAKERFLLAQLYLGQPNEEKYQSEMLKLLSLKSRNAQHLAHFVNYWIDRNKLDQADRWLADLKKAEPLGVAVLELEAKLLDLRKLKPDLLTLLDARGRDVPDQIGIVADLLSRFGFAKEAESAYKAFIARDATQPQRALALAQFLSGRDRVADSMGILQKAWSTCRPEQVAGTALFLFDAPSAGEAEKRQIEAWVAEAVEKRPDMVTLASKLGVIRVRQGRFDEADSLLRRLLASDPDNVDALNNLAWLISLRDSSKASEAIELIDRAIAIEGEAAFLTDTRAVARIQLGQVDQAVAELLAIRKQAPQNPSFALHLAWAYHAKSKTAQARTELREAEKLGLKPAALDPLEQAVFERLRKELSSG